VLPQMLLRLQRLRRLMQLQPPRMLLPRMLLPRMLLPRMLLLPRRLMMLLRLWMRRPLIPPPKTRRLLTRLPILQTSIRLPIRLLRRQRQ
jgi:hypothetical protein